MFIQTAIEKFQEVEDVIRVTEGKIYFIKDPLCTDTV